MGKEEQTLANIMKKKAQQERLHDQKSRLESFLVLTKQAKTEDDQDKIKNMLLELE